MMQRAQRSLLAVAAIAITLATAHVALRRRPEVARCPEFSEARAARCCPSGQRLETVAGAQHCAGRASRCPAGLTLGAEGHCVALSRRVLIEGGEAQLGPSDWEAQGVVEPRRLRVARF